MHNNWLVSLRKKLDGCSVTTDIAGPPIAVCVRYSMRVGCAGTGPVHDSLYPPKKHYDLRKSV